MSIGTMNRKKSKPAGSKPMIFSMRGSDEFRDWLGRAADHCNLSVAGLLTQAVIEYVRRRGFPEAPPKR